MEEARPSADIVEAATTVAVQAVRTTLMRSLWASAGCGCQGCQREAARTTTWAAAMLPRRVARVAPDQPSTDA